MDDLVKMYHIGRETIALRVGRYRILRATGLKTTGMRVRSKLEHEEEVGIFAIAS
jgi:hypothetical protein